MGCIAKGTDLWGEDVALQWQSQRRKHAQTIRVPEHMTPDLARWLGYLIAEGDVCHDGTVRFTNAEDELRTDYAQLTQCLFEITPRLYPGVVQLNSVSLADFLAYLGFKTGAYNKEIPWAVLQSSRKSMLEFLAGYFAGDGTINLRGRLSWTTASEVLSRQLQVVLLNLGVIARRVKTFARSSSIKEKGEYWNVTASGADADLLASQMRLLPQRKLLEYQRLSQKLNMLDEPISFPIQPDTGSRYPTSCKE